MTLAIDIQRASETTKLPTEGDFRRWAAAALAGRRSQAEITIRLVDEAESRQLNLEYRGQDRPTNILSFPFQAPPMADLDLMGDLVVCAPVVIREAREQGKSLQAHWAHMTIHGVLHLLGFDHQGDRQADTMERLEVALLSGLGFPDPYQDQSRG